MFSATIYFLVALLIESTLAFSIGGSFRDALIHYEYDCPITGKNQRDLIIRTRFDGPDTTFENRQSAEYIFKEAFHVGPRGGYEVDAYFRHGFCLPIKGRHCGYMIEGILAAANGPAGPRFALAEHGAPLPNVKESCTEPGGTSKGCSHTAGKDCKIIEARAI